ncbi:MAG: phosphate acyltransferase PlsX [Bacillota bacterium]|nr:phosphate acyltransferase PlsX [Bacillota bacterium]
MKIAVDAMGGDNAPSAVVEGCLMALNEYHDVKINLYGRTDEINALLSGKTYDSKRLNIIHTEQVITNHEHPVEAIKRKKDSSMVAALQALADEKVDACISAGNTGALLAGAILIVRRSKGIKRPGLAPILPTAAGKGVLVIDAGANADCRPDHLAQFAVMGSIFMEKVMSVKNPKVGLLNIGSEEEKGNELTKAAYPLLQTMPINFKGNCEGREALSGDFDVIVCDGFVGNVLLKNTEGTAAMLFSALKSELKKNFRSKIGAFLCMPALKRLKDRMDYTEYGGAPLLGISKGVIKAHGSSDAKAIKNSIRQARAFVKFGVAERIADVVAQIEAEQIFIEK